MGVELVPLWWVIPACGQLSFLYLSAAAKLKVHQAFCGELRVSVERFPIVDGALEVAHPSHSWSLHSANMGIAVVGDHPGIVHVLEQTHFNEQVHLTGVQGG